MCNIFWVNVVDSNVPIVEFVVSKGRVNELVEAFDNSPVAHTGRAYSADGSAFRVRGLKVDGSEVEHEGLRMSGNRRRVFPHRRWHAYRVVGRIIGCPKMGGLRLKRYSVR